MRSCTTLAALILLAPSVAGAFVSDRDLQAKAKEIKERLERLSPESRFHVFVESPFVVVGDGERAAVKRRAQGTVRWTVRSLKDLYFEEDPSEPLEIWLFDGAKSYRTHAWRLFRHRPSTPYGYFSSSDDALIMNIRTGGGTLVHELVHPYIAANFPDSPPWLDEGLGSLYEHSGEKDGHIVGYTNWRLPILQEAIRSGPIPSFKWLMNRTSFQFYERDPGTNYAQARYLLYYLQERGLLVEYYQRFFKNRRQDPTGYNSLVSVLGRRDMKRFQKEWEGWVLKLKRR